MSGAVYYTIKDGSIFIPATAWFKERCIAAITESNREYIVSSLEERFAGLEQKVAEIEQRCSDAADETKLDGLIARTRTYICTAIAIGDYGSLLARLDALEARIKDNSSKIADQKEALCAAAEVLLAGNDSKEAAQQMKELQQHFRSLPPGFDERSQALRKRFESVNDAFFKRRKDAFDAAEKEMEANLLLKIQLCEKAEAMQERNDWKAATEAYQQLNEEWKKAGHVPRHRRDELWLRFNGAKDVFFARKKQHFESLKTAQEESYAKKLELVEKAEALQHSTDWKQTTEAYRQLMEEWKQAGYAGQERGDEVWKRFMAPQDFFYKNRDAHYSKVKTELDDNYARKMALVTHAEQLQHSDDFDTATQEFMDMFEEWKGIGRLAREHGDVPWERFITAKKNFFARKDAWRAERRSSLVKDLEERLGRDRSYLNRLNRQLASEEQLVDDINDRIANLASGLRNYQKREEYLETLEEVKANILTMQEDVQRLQQSIRRDEKELYQLRRPHQKKEDAGKEEAPAEKTGEETAE